MGFYFRMGLIFEKNAKTRKCENYPHVKISTFTESFVVFAITISTLHFPYIFLSGGRGGYDRGPPHDGRGHPDGRGQPPPDYRDNSWDRGRDNHRGNWMPQGGRGNSFVFILNFIFFCIFFIVI